VPEKDVVKLLKLYNVKRKPPSMETRLKVSKSLKGGLDKGFWKD